MLKFVLIGLIAIPLIIGMGLAGYAAGGGEVRSKRKPTGASRLVAGRCAIDRIGVPTGMGCGRGSVGRARAGMSGGMRSRRSTTRMRGVRLPA